MGMKASVEIFTDAKIFITIGAIGTLIVVPYLKLIILKAGGWLYLATFILLGLMANWMISMVFLYSLGRGFGLMIGVIIFVAQLLLILVL
jgi:hypothetical protein